MSSSVARPLDGNVVGRQNRELCVKTCTGRRAVYGLLVTAQFIMASLIVVVLTSPGHLFIPSVLQLGGVAFGLSAILTMRIKRLRATPALAEGSELIRHGPYRFVRHPMYSALLIFSSSYVISDGSWLSVQLWLSLFVVLLTKLHYEEVELRSAFHEYDDYARKTNRLIPWVW